MPRLTVDPQVKSNQHLPYAVASWAVLNWWVMKTHLMFSGEPLIFSHPFLRSKTWLMAFSVESASPRWALSEVLTTTA